MNFLLNVLIFPKTNNMNKNIVCSVDKHSDKNIHMKNEQGNAEFKASDEHCPSLLIMFVLMLKICQFLDKSFLREPFS